MEQDMEVDYPSEEETGEVNEVTNGEESVPEKERTLVSCWKNKQEFETVTDLLYGSNPNHGRALEILQIWKTRRMDQTPATILATIALLEVTTIDKEDSSQFELRVLYSSALTRFYSYVSSTVQGRTGNTRRTMYELASDLEIASVIVDLRHISSHGQDIPSLEMLRSSSQYCLEWIQSYYWEKQLETMRDCELSDLRKVDTNEFDETITRLFRLYDIGIEAVFQKREELNVVKNFMHKSKYELLKEYSDEKGGIEQVYELMDVMIQDLFAYVKKSRSIKDLNDIYMAAFLKMRSFFEIAAKITTMEQLQLAIKSTKLLFTATAMNSLTENVYHTLIDVCENPSEELYKRKGSGFWANEIVKGFVAFQRLRVYCYEKNIGDTKRPLDLKGMIIAKEIQKAYKKLRIDTERTLIFGDSLKRPWRLTFDREYILKRMENLNEFTADVVKSCIDLVNPAFTEAQAEELITLIDIKVGYNDEQESKAKAKSDEKIYELSDLGSKKDCNGGGSVVTRNEDQDLVESGPWTKETGDWSWSECPIGILPWE
ncbi:LAS1L family protein [Megaselia abdita]